MTDRSPHLVLATLPEALQARLDALRRAHYPAARNHHPAHLTLFHAIPGMVAGELTGLLAALAAQTPPPRIVIDRVIDLDSGTALGVYSPDLVMLRDTIADHFHGLLTGGDAVPPRLHVTIQNKVDRPAARALQRTLAASWHTLEAQVPALAMHRVVDGVWLPVGTWRFRAQRR